MTDDIKKTASIYSDPTFAGVDPSLLGDIEYDPVSTSLPLGAMPVSSKDVSSMKDLLGRLADLSESTTTSLVESARTNSELSEAIRTRRTPNSVVFDNQFEIQIIEGKRKRFNVVESQGTVVAEHLYLYESAHAIVKLLNRGKPALDPQIRHIVGLEENYSSAYLDAMRFKKKLSVLRESRERDIYSAKYQHARERALEAKYQIESILKNL